MAQSKEEKNRKARERQARLKELGIPLNQRRNLGKARATDESILEKTANFLYKLFQGVEDAASNVIESADGINSDLNAALSDIPTFEEYVTMNPDLSGRKLKDTYRKMGGKIGNARAATITREVKHTPYNYKKNTAAKGIRYYPPKHNPRHSGLIIKKRYQYYVSYYVRVDEYDEPDNRFATIPSDNRLDADEVMDALFIMFDVMRRSGENSKEEKYKGLEIVDDDPEYPIRILYAIDKEMK